MTGSISAPTTIWYSTVAGTASAAAGDFTAAVNQHLTFTPGGPMIQQITVPILIEPGNPPENAETFSVGLQAFSGGRSFATGSATIAANGGVAAFSTLSPSGPVQSGPDEAGAPWRPDNIAGLVWAVSHRGGGADSSASLASVQHGAWLSEAMLGRIDDAAAHHTSDLTGSFAALQIVAPAFVDHGVWFA
jgi:hypothetical protein